MCQLLLCSGDAGPQRGCTWSSRRSWAQHAPAGGALCRCWEAAAPAGPASPERAGWVNQLQVRRAATCCHVTLATGTRTSTIPASPEGVFGPLLSACRADVGVQALLAGQPSRFPEGPPGPACSFVPVAADLVPKVLGLQRGAPGQ